ncbi:MAG TPA: amino acid adenylation domain-containing protein [Streptosporangiaceae bacterium]|nr:amino acid adenylation domain-containing protein [Streptosporangiaceae bacterium]
MTVDGLVWKQVQARPFDIAVADASGEYTYEQLWRTSGRIAGWLRSAGVGHGDIVAIMLPPGMRCIAAMLAAAQVGGIYLPLDGDDPPARREQILSDATPAVLIVDDQRAGASHGVRELVLGADPAGDRGDLAPPTGRHGSRDAVYLLYTSGSTGTPKGVLIEHRGVENLVTDPRLGLSEGTIMAHCCRDAFDVSTFEIWGPLTMGGTCVVLTPREALDPATLAASIKNHGITTLFLTTAVLNFVAEEGLSELRLLDALFFGGEGASPPHLGMMVELLAGSGTRLINAYGPTENTMMSTMIDIDEHNYRDAPIGTPLHNMQAYLIDDAGAVLEGDATGELCMSGPGLARCYLNRPDLTAERFVTLELGTGPERVYRTGDECRRVSGVLTFVGRRDGMVKLLGHRVELGEIEAALMQHECVTGAVLVADKRAGDTRLLAYLRGERTVPATAMRGFLVGRIPRYMIPAEFAWVGEFPLDANGKVNRRALLAADGAAGGRDEAPGAGGHPRAGHAAGAGQPAGAVAPVAPGQADGLRIQPHRFETTLRALARIGADPQGGLSRLGLSTAETEARSFLCDVARAAGLSASTDAAANLFISRRPLDRDRSGSPVVLFGSHLDTVRQGGWLDGAYGVVAAIEALATLHESGLPCALEPVAVAFSNEEGAGVQYPFWGSRAVASSLTDWEHAADQDGKPVAACLSAAGGDPGGLSGARWERGSIAAFLELHIEQGTTLESQRIPIGIVDAITGRSVFEIEVCGRQGHPGTVPMPARHDALAAAARLVLEIEDLSVARGACATSTVGFIENHPNTVNTIPGRVRMTAEIRDVTAGGLDGGETKLRGAASEVARERGVEVVVSRSHRCEPVRTAQFLRSAAAAAAATLGAETLVMPSGAGHDAQIVAAIAPVGMIFVPSRAGVSHRADENSDMVDLCRGADVLLRSVARLVSDSWPPDRAPEEGRELTAHPS